MSSLRTYRIIFEKPGAVYMTGEVVRGTIILDTAKVKTIRGIYIIAKGSAFVRWTERETRSGSNGKSETVTNVYRASQQYFSIRGEILEPRGPDSRIVLPEGCQQYQFQFQLPSNIPSSFEHRHGYVRYTVKAIIDRPWKFDHECKIAFTVVSVLDLNMHRHRCLGIHEEIQKNFSCCCFGLGSMNTSIRVPSSGYVSGQMISASVNYKNASSQVGIRRIELKLERVLKLHATTKTKTEYFKIISSSNAGPFTPEGVITLEIRVPPIPPSHQPFCSIIDLDYYLKVVVYFTSTHLKLQRSYPLLIGTIPLYCAPSASATQQMNAMPYPTEQPATSSTMSMPETPQPSTTTTKTQPAQLGFVIPDQANSSANCNIPPPSYEECMLGAQNIRDDDESVHVQGTNAPFRPKYPVFNYPAPSAP
ncbi:arrestin domain-containing protein 2 [Megalopta genalis]|uniref:arrestin domain-containing protein 2 n=1 Tax=Megalopta genalis TaxID=115081 RepID=UPI003FD4F66D